jgi:CHAT domain-containing protein
VLWRVPFEALPLHDAYLGDRAVVTYASSLSARVRPPATAGTAMEGFLGIASPDLPPPLVSYVTQTAPDWTLRTAVDGEHELKVAMGDSDAARASLLSGAAATKAGVRDTLPRASAIHVAAPFRVNGANALFSPILLSAPPRPADAPAGASDDPSTMTLDAREIANLDLHASLAVLSDGAALTMRDAASELSIVQWAWRVAGVPSLLLSRWPGDGPARDALLVELYRQLRAGAKLEDALLAARRVVKRTAAWSTPFYWSGWITIGEPQ